MFRTYRQTAIQLCTRLEPDLQLWPYVEQILHLPWFYVTVARGKADAVSREMLMISDVLTLEGLQLDNNSGAIEDLLLVSPATMNGQNRWMMDPLLEISYVEGTKTCRRHYRYVLLGGKTYTNDCDPGLEAEQANRSRRVISRESGD